MIIHLTSFHHNGGWSLELVVFVRFIIIIFVKSNCRFLDHFSMFF